MVLTLAPEQTLGWNQVSPADYLDWKNQSLLLQRYGSQWNLEVWKAGARRGY